MHDNHSRTPVTDLKGMNRSPQKKREKERYMLQGVVPIKSSSEVMISTLLTCRYVVIYALFVTKTSVEVQDFYKPPR